MSEHEDQIKRIKRQTQGQDQFHQAVDDVMEHVLPFVGDKQEYMDEKIVERLLTPDRVIEFRVTWRDDNKEIQTNRGFRVQYNNAIGPYKGGLRFHPSVTLDTFKFLAFEQTFKNALTGLPMGGGKGGSDFDPKGKSEAEVMRFCQAFMMELHKYIGPDHDIPAGDIGVGNREIGYLFGAYKQITGVHHGVLTGKNPAFGGSCIRKEATGYGCVYFLKDILEAHDDKLEGKRCAISGAGNVALYTAEKLIEEGASVITLSDSKGYICAKDGISEEQLAVIRTLKEEKRGRLSDLNEKGITYHDGKKPWQEEYDVAIPAATQNEVEIEDAKNIQDAGASVVCEAANMPLTAEATDFLREKDMTIAPAKAANAGGVVVSGLERTQNAQRLSWGCRKVDETLQRTMKDIHDICAEYGKSRDQIDYIKGANIGGFVSVADAMKAYGVI